jgi:tetratricopeptide (TPR) repeat protein
MGWLYEAEDVLAKVQEQDLSRKNAPLYAAVSADILMKTQRYQEAIPFIKIALPNEDRHGNQPRFYYILGQLYQLQGDKKAARNAFKKVLKLQPDSEMDFNTRLQLAQLEVSASAAITLLTKMAKQDKNKDRLDQIYGTLGDILLAQGDTTNALEYYALGIEGSTMNGMNKAAILITAGDLYYQQRNYV